MHCIHCGNPLEEDEKYCPNCGTKIQNTADTLSPSHLPSQDSVEPPKGPKRKKAKPIIFSLIILVVIGGLGTFIYFSIFGQTIDFTTFNTKSTKTLTLGKERIYDKKDETLTLMVTIDDLNSYISERTIRNAIDYGDIRIEKIALSNRTNKVFIRASKGNLPSIDIEANYSMTLKNDGIHLNLTYTKGGFGIPVLNIFALNPFIQQQEMIIPLNLENDDDLHLAFIMDMINGNHVSSDIRSKKLYLTFSLTKETFASSESPYLWENSINVETIKKDDTKYFDLTQAEVINEFFAEDALLTEQFKDLNYTGEIRIDDEGKVLLRCQDDTSSLLYDVKLDVSASLEEDIHTTINSLSLYNRTIATLDNANEFIISLNDSLEKQPITALEKFNVTDIEEKDDFFRFYSNQKDWTIMVYMNGSDLESGYDGYYDDIAGYASSDLEEMITSLNSDNIQIIVETGGTLEWENQLIDASQNQRWEIKDGTLNHLSDLGKQNMCVSDTLEDFLTWSMDNYTADRYALIMWNHGGGSLYGFGYDEYFEYDSLTIDELSVALDGATSATGNTLEVVGFDACLMATLETSAAIAPYANYLIASEELEPGIGWDYTKILEDLSLNSGSNGHYFGEVVTAGFVSTSIQEEDDETVTLSVIDLDEISDVVTSMETLITEITSDIESDYGYMEFASIIPQVKAFGGSIDSIEYYDHFDLENFAKKLVEYYPNKANGLIAAIDDAVIYKSSGYLATDAGGISFYLPYYNLDEKEFTDDIYEPVSFSDIYTEFIEKFVTYHLLYEEDDISIDYEYIISDDAYDPYQIEVDSGDLDSISDIYLGVYIIDNNDLMIDLGIDALVYETDVDNIFEEDFSSWPTLGDDYLPIYITYESEEFIEYETPILLNGERSTMITAWIKSEQRYETFGARPGSLINDNGALDRETISFEEGDVIIPLYYTNDYYTFEEGELEGTPYTVGNTSPEIVNGDFQTGYSYGLQFVFLDYNNEYHYTDPLEFEFIE